MALKPKIFVFINGGSGTDWVTGCAIAEDGHCLASHVSSSNGWSRHDMGLDGSKWKHELYTAHYPNGYDLVDVPPSEVATHAGLIAAYAKNQELAKADREVAA